MLGDRNKESINRKGVSRKIKNLLSHDYDYVLMKLFSRVYLFKRLFLFFNRIGQPINISKLSSPVDDAVELIDGVAVHEIVDDIFRDGCSAKIKINGETLRQIIDFAFNTRCYAYGDSKQGFYLSQKDDCEKMLRKNILLAKYFNFQKMEIFNGLINSSLLGSIASAYLGGGAKNIATQLWWTFPADVDTNTRSKAAHFFHRDVDA